MRRSAGELLMQQHLRELKVPFEIEYRFHPTRRWRADFAYPQHRILVEVEGGVFARGRHTRGKGFERDLEKTNAAALLGWTVYCFTTCQVMTGIAKTTIAQALATSPAAAKAHR